MSNLKQAVEEAFEEGTQSPCDLKDSVVDDLVKKFGSGGLDIDLLSKDAAIRVSNNAHDIIKEILTACNEVSPNSAILTGGAIVRCLMRTKSDYRQNWSDSGNDMFIDTAVINFLKDYCGSKNYKLGRSSSRRINRPHPLGLRDWNFKISDSKYISILEGQFSNNIENMTKHNDLTISQFAFYKENKSFKIHGSEESWHDLMHNLIRFSKNYSPEKEEGKSVRRKVVKYIRRGFRDTTGTVEQGTFFQN